VENDTSEPNDSGEAQEAIMAPDRSAPHPRLPQYSVDEVERSIEVIELLIKVRDRCRKQGLINW
jgi:hypothetical protein